MEETSDEAYPLSTSADQSEAAEIKAIIDHNEIKQMNYSVLSQQVCSLDTLSHKATQTLDQKTEIKEEIFHEEWKPLLNVTASVKSEFSSSDDVKPSLPCRQHGVLIERRDHETKILFEDEFIKDIKIDNSGEFVHTDIKPVLQVDFSNAKVESNILQVKEEQADVNSGDLYPNSIQNLTGELPRTWNPSYSGQDEYSSPPITNCEVSNTATNTSDNKFRDGDSNQNKFSTQDFSGSFMAFLSNQDHDGRETQNQGDSSEEQQRSQEISQTRTNVSDRKARNSTSATFSNSFMTFLSNRQNLFSCEVCKASFTSMYYLRQHKRQQKEGICRYTFSCKLCNALFSSKNRLEQHELAYLH